MPAFETSESGGGSLVNTLIDAADRQHRCIPGKGAFIYLFTLYYIMHKLQGTV